MSRILINALGREFNISESLLEKIPYFVDAMLKAKYEPVIYVDRSPIGLEHVLSYVSDSDYPFPREFEYELAFYGLMD